MKAPQPVFSGYSLSSVWLTRLKFASSGFLTNRLFEADTPMGRMANVDELVGPAIFLSSQAASFCTGVDLVVDGGFVCW